MVTDEKFEKTINIILNMVIVGTGITMAAFSKSFSSLAGTFTKEMGEAMAEVSAPKGKKAAAKAEVKKASKEMQRQTLVEMEKMTKVLLRKLQEVTSKLEAQKEQIKNAFTDEFCDEGIKIIDQYKFKLSKFYERFSEKDISEYIILALKNGQPFSKMMEELSVWMDKAPAPLTKLAKT